MKNKTVYFIAQGAMVAALYAVLTLVSQALGLLSFDVQLRFSEALCVLPMFTGAAVPGLALGCVLANLLTAGAPWDIVFGSLATLIGAVVCRVTTGLLQKKGKDRAAIWLSPVPNVIANTAILPFIIKWVYESEMSIPLITAFVLLGELASCALGIPLAMALNKNRGAIFNKLK